MMIEKIVRSYLKGKLGIDVYMEKPEGSFDDLIPFVTVEKAGGYGQNHIAHATISIRSYGKTLYKASELNEKVKKAMDGITGTANVSACSLNSDTNFTDTTTKQYRYQAVFNITYMD